MSRVEVGNTILIRKIGKITPNLLRLRFDLCTLHQTITTDTTDFKSHKLDEQAKVVKKTLHCFLFQSLHRKIITYSVTTIFVRIGRSPLY